MHFIDSSVGLQCTMYPLLFHLSFFKVGLLGMGRTLQGDLNRIAETADTSSADGLGYVLTGEPIYIIIHAHSHNITELLELVFLLYQYLDVLPY